MQAGAAAQTVLTVSPDPITVTVRGAGTADVAIDSKSNNVTAVQLELKYDPTAITDVKLTTGDFLTQPIVLINRRDEKAGTVTYAIGINPSQKPRTGKGIVAHIAFSKVQATKAKSTSLSLLDTSIVTSSGIDGSVLKSVSGAKVILSQ